MPSSQSNLRQKFGLVGGGRVRDTRAATAYQRLLDDDAAYFGGGGGYDAARYGSFGGPASFGREAHVSGFWADSPMQMMGPRLVGKRGARRRPTALPPRLAPQGRVSAYCVAEEIDLARLKQYFMEKPDRKPGSAAAATLAEAAAANPGAVPLFSGGSTTSPITATAPSQAQQRQQQALATPPQPSAAAAADISSSSRALSLDERYMGGGGGGSGSINGPPRAMPANLPLGGGGGAGPSGMNAAIAAAARRASMADAALLPPGSGSLTMTPGVAAVAEAMGLPSRSLPGSGPPSVVGSPSTRLLAPPPPPPLLPPGTQSPVPSDGRSVAFSLEAGGGAGGGAGSGSWGAVVGPVAAAQAAAQGGAATGGRLGPPQWRDTTAFDVLHSSTLFEGCLLNEVLAAAQAAAEAEARAEAEQRAAMERAAAESMSMGGIDGADGLLPMHGMEEASNGGVMGDGLMDDGAGINGLDSVSPNPTPLQSPVPGSPLPPTGMVSLPSLQLGAAASSAAGNEGRRSSRSGGDSGGHGASAESRAAAGAAAAAATSAAAASGVAFPKHKDVFYFAYGCVIFWGMTADEEKRLLAELKKFTREPVSLSELERSHDVMQYVYDPLSTPLDKISNDQIPLRTMDAKERLSYSHAVAQSAKLFVFEEQLEGTIEDTKHLPAALAQSGVVHLEKGALNKMVGRVFTSWNDVNLHSDILDLPDLFWQDDTWEQDYKRACDYLHIPNRVQVLNRRLEIVRELLKLLQEQAKDEHATHLEMIVIWLIALELVLGLVEIYIQLTIESRRDG